MEANGEEGTRERGEDRVGVSEEDIDDMYNYLETDYRFSAATKSVFESYYPVTEG